MEHAEGRGSRLVVGWAGHRRLENVEPVRASIGSVLDRLLTLTGGNKRLAGVGSMAIGADVEFAEAFAARGIPWFGVLPWRLDGFETSASDPDRARVVSAASAAASIEVVESSALTANEAYLETGLRVVEECDVLIVVWDGQAARGKGGTGDVVDLAKARGKPVIRIASDTGAIELPESLPTVTGDAPPTTREEVLAQFKVLDESANKSARPARNLLLRIILIHLFASALIVLALALYPALKDEGGAAKSVAKPIVFGATLVEVCALLVAVFLAVKHRSSHHRWLDDRSAAELCRSYLSVWPMPRWAVRPPAAPLASLRGLSRELELAWRLARPEAIELDDAKSWYEESQTDDPCSGRIAGQVRYFSEKAEESERRSRIFHHAATGCTIAAVLIGITSLALMASDHSHGVGYASFKGVGVVLPLVSAALFSFVTAGDHSRRTARYREIETRLKVLAERVRESATWHELGRVIDEVEALLLAENAEWHAFQRFAGEPHA